MRSFIIYLFAFSLISCVASPKINKKLENNEGFYFLDKIPQKKLSKFSISQKTIDATSPYVGGFARSVVKNMDKKEIKSFSEKKCSKPYIRKWHKYSCQQVESCSAKGSCIVRHESYCTGVVVGKYFLTARHCLKSMGPKSHYRAAFLVGKRVKFYNLEETYLSNHQLPYDVVIFKIRGFPKRKRTIKIREGSFNRNESVYGIGFPYIKGRKNKAADYEPAWSDLRVTFGRVTEPNNERGSYCHFSNNVLLAKPEKWVLSPNCPEKGFREKEGYTARVEENILLTNTDMIYGMSGSPLFDRHGNLIGIGTTVLNSHPGDYSPEKNAVYVKAENVAKMLKALKKM